MTPNNIDILDPANFYKCKNIWDIEQQPALAKKFYDELTAGNRITYVVQKGTEYIGEISLVFEMNDPDYTIADKRVYTSRLIVKANERRKGVGRLLVNHAIEQAEKMGFTEMSIGVDLNNYPAIKLYTASGFNQITFIGEDEQGKYMKLLKKL